MRLTGDGAAAVVCVNGGRAGEVEGTWSASLEWLVRRLAPQFPEIVFCRGAFVPLGHEPDETRGEDQCANRREEARRRSHRYRALLSRKRPDRAARHGVKKPAPIRRERKGEGEQRKPAKYEGPRATDD